MALSQVALVLMALLGLAQAQIPPNQIYRRFEYKHSFRAPNLAQRDGTIPFWVITGDAIASNEQLRLVPSMRSRKGIAWNKRPFTEADSFEVEVAFKVTGQRIGADGFAVWYTATQGTLGPVYGANDYWTGLALMFDSFDNDGQHNNPYVSVMVNDGTKSYNHQTDGSSQILSGCQRDYRNRPYPVRVRLQYLNHVLTVEMSDGLTPQPRFENCVRVENVFLPTKGFFGVSAATGGLADDHDIVDFSVFSLASQAEREANARAIPQDERQRYDAEFEKQMHEFEEEKKKFKQEHPEKAREDEEDPGKYYEDAESRELRLIHESQAAIYKILQQMELKLNQIQQGQGGQVQQQPGQTAPAVAGAGFQQHEKNEVIQSLRDLTAQLRDMKNYVNEIFTRSYNIEQKLGGGVPVQASAGAAQPAAGLDAYTKQYLENIQAEVRQIRASQVGGQPVGQAFQGGTQALCPEVACTSTTFFLLVILLQSGVIVGVVFLRSKQDKAKFY